MPPEVALVHDQLLPAVLPVLGKPFPEEPRRKLARHMEANQAEDGYLGDHVAAAFHMAHFYRLLGEPTPRADRMVARVLRDQKPDGGWDIKEPDWDVHAGFDAVFILRQLGGDGPKVRGAIAGGRTGAALPQRRRRASATSPAGPRTWTPSTSSSAR